MLALGLNVGNQVNSSYLQLKRNKTTKTKAK